MGKNIPQLSELFNSYLARTKYKLIDLSRILHVSRSTISRWASGDRVPSIEHLSELSKLFGLNKDEIRTFFTAAGREAYLEMSIASIPPSASKQDPPKNVNSTQRIVPLQFPPRVPFFVGREKEIEQILKDLQPGRVITLVGPGGIGKSAIVSEVVRQLAQSNETPKQFPDGIIFHNFNEEPHAQIALENFVLSFDQEPQPTPALAAQRIFARRQALLVLDGVENADNLKEVLEVRSECGVLVTSRRREDAFDLRYRYIITPLSIKNSVELLQGWGGAFVDDEKVATEICKLLDGLPLALRLAGRYIANQEEDISYYLRWLEDERLATLDQGKHEDESVPILLSHSLEKISQSAQAVLAVIGLLAAMPFSHEVLEATLNLSRQQIHFALGELVNYSLLARLNKQYKVTHTLIHNYAQNYLSVPDEVITQLFAYYTTLAEAQYELGDVDRIKIRGSRKLWLYRRGINNNLISNFQSDSQKTLHLRKLDDFEESHIEAILNIGIKQKKWNLVERLAATIAPYSLKQLQLDPIVIIAGYKAAVERNDWGMYVAWNMAIEICTAPPPPYDFTLFELKYFRFLGTLYTFQGKLHQAVKCFQRALIHASKFDYAVVDEQLILAFLGTVYIRLGNIEQAIKHLEQALARPKSKYYELFEIDWHISLIECYKTQNSYIRAIEAYKELIELRPNNPFIYDDLARCYLHLKQLDEAEYFYNRRVDLAPDNALNAYVSLGIIALLKGEKNQAEKYFQNALAVFQAAYQQETQSKTSLLAAKALAQLCLEQTESVLVTLKEALIQDQLKLNCDLIDYDLLATAPEPPDGLPQIRRLLEATLKNTRDNL